MGFASGYTLHCYCDKCEENGRQRYTMDEYVADGKGCREECYRQARKDGWLLGKYGKCLCPEHSGKKGKK